ncbi:hypothetical protein [Prosthecobacter fluviatilis]|uniref:DGQHR domain-containing protein n=1 Tax=Prosthecobacter fluviatilis TaxID=445931 RepID=A0ABW0KSG9_9BACT
MADDKQQGRKRRKRKKRKSTPQELEQRALRKDVRAVFSDAGFKKVLSVSDKEFKFKDRKGDFDDIFVYKNVIVLAEYTCSSESNVSDHLLKKKVLFDLINSDQQAFLEMLETTFPTFADARDTIYSDQDCRIKILYCSRHNLLNEHKIHLPEVVFFDYPILRYFKIVTAAVKRSSIYEFLHFIGLSCKDIGFNASSKKDATGFVLPESYSSFPKGYKVVTFYIDAGSLLERAYVLRSDGWSDAFGTYQRMIVPAKIASMRKYLNSERRVFVNNVIATLPSGTKILDDKGDTVQPTALTQIQSATIQIPRGFNTVGLVDGQHRVFSYHEGGEYEEVIAQLRQKQNLLVTGIIYPIKATELDRMKFEARLFLEINSTQSNAKSDLKQAIGLVLKPFSSESIAKAVIHKMNCRSPLEGCFEEYFFEKDKVKTMSIVSYGLKPLVKLSGNDSFYSIWDDPQKSNLLKEDDRPLLEKYIDYCSSQICIFMSAVKASISPSHWTTDKKCKEKILTTSVINGLVICLRLLIQNNMISDFAGYKRSLAKLSSFNFSQYKSSQYAAMARDLYSNFFETKDG